MKSVGIIVEYNPFHNGHAYHAKMARQKSGAEVVIAVMSGNFLQRGEPAIVDKWQRAEAALHNGVDLVVELPVSWSVQAADYFAKGGVKLLQALNCDSLCFGTEDSVDFDYQAFGNFAWAEQERVNTAFQQISDQKLSYPQKMSLVYQELFPALHLSGEQPNHVLGLTYAKENASYSRPMKLIPIQRKGAAYHEAGLVQEFASATGIRQGVQRGVDVSPWIPSQTMNALLKEQVTWEKLWPLLRYRLLASRKSELQTIYQMVEGLETRLMNAARNETDYQSFLSQIKSKRYTWTRMQRLLCYTLLNITQEEMTAAWEQPALRILGYTKSGRAYLHQNKKNLQLPLLSKIGQGTTVEQVVSKRADELYRLGDQRVPEQNIGRFPLRVEIP
ncbi:nucleotidyltransferase [Enterococcus sp. 2201sp1_2201st1_B8_2201SCRN_220225]|uniref:nucleotidyltransferase n=1 Tax=unclassified Enterococcus TaxID=2608891 RepID=UPI0034A142D3